MRSNNLTIGIMMLAACLMLSLTGTGLAQDPYLASLLPAPPGFTLSSVQRNAVTSTLNAAQQGELDVIGQLLSKDPLSSKVRSRWEFLITQTERTNLDINAMIQWVLRQAYLSSLENIRTDAEKVKEFNEAKRAIREESTRARDAYSRLGYSQSLEPAQGDFKIPFYPNTAAWRLEPKEEQPPAAINSSGALAEYIEALEDERASVGDDAQLANIDLQNSLQKQQQTMQTMSNVSKMLHDTGMATIRKIG